MILQLPRSHCGIRVAVQLTSDPFLHFTGYRKIGSHFPLQITARLLPNHRQNP